MKAAFALLTLLPLLGAATSELPTVDVTTLDGGLFKATPGDQATPGEKANVGDANVLVASACPAGYPFICYGRCCQYNICCPNSCCGPYTQFCGADGLCYRYT